MVATVLGYLACDYLFIAPRGQVLRLDAQNFTGLLLYLVSCAAIIAIAAAMHATRRSLEARQRDLEQAVEHARRAEEDLRSQTEENERFLPAAVWVAHDTECHTVTGNEYANRLLRLDEAANVYADLPAGERPWVRHVRDGRELAADELPLLRTLATGRGVENIEFSLETGTGGWSTCSATPARS